MAIAQTSPVLYRCMLVSLPAAHQFCEVGCLHLSLPGWGKAVSTRCGCRMRRSALSGSTVSASALANVECRSFKSLRPSPPPSLALQRSRLLLDLSSRPPPCNCVPDVCNCNWCAMLSTVAYTQCKPDKAWQVAHNSGNTCLAD